MRLDVDSFKLNLKKFQTFVRCFILNEVLYNKIKQPEINIIIQNGYNLFKKLSTSEERVVYFYSNMFEVKVSFDSF